MPSVYSFESGDNLLMDLLWQLINKLPKETFPHAVMIHDVLWNLRDLYRDLNHG